MATLSPSSLDSPTLARRLGELAGDERRVQVDFLLHLDEFDRRRAFLELGYNLLYAEETYGREHMRKYRKGAFAIAGGGNGTVPVAREAMAVR